MADFEEGTEEWDDVQALETEAQGTLGEMFNRGNASDNGFETDDGESSVQVHVIEDSPESKNKPDVMELDSSSDFEDDDDDDDTQFKATRAGSRSHSLRSMVKIQPCVYCFMVLGRKIDHCLAKTLLLHLHSNERYIYVLKHPAPL